MDKKSIDCANNVVPIRLWPLYMKRMIFGKVFINRFQRISCVCFLVGNGIIDESTIMGLLLNKLRDRQAEIHIKSLVKDCLGNAYDRIFTYHNVNENCILYLSGEIAYERQEKYNSFLSKLNIWNRYSFKHQTNLKMQLDFFGEVDGVYDKIVHKQSNIGKIL
tara:strand:- start:739 stop:1227 length:489 start_codon:yes stop_codon:yes gene_type:complete